MDRILKQCWTPADLHSLHAASIPTSPPILFHCWDDISDINGISLCAKGPPAKLKRLRQGEGPPIVHISRTFATLGEDVGIKCF